MAITMGEDWAGACSTSECCPIPARRWFLRITLQSDHPFRRKPISRFGVSDHL